MDNNKELGTDIVSGFFYVKLPDIYYDIKNVYGYVYENRYDYV